MGTLTVSKAKFGTQKINAKDLKIYMEAGWSVIETPAPAVPKEVAHIAEHKAARKAKADKNAEQ
jgi:hypothetical protein